MGFLVHYNYQDILSEFCTCFRRLYILRENFSTCSLKFLEFDVPIMALTATATIRVREDILHGNTDCAHYIFPTKFKVFSKFHVSEYSSWDIYYAF